MKKFIEQKGVSETQYLMGVIPLDNLSMCQYCGNFKHPTEFCKQAINFPEDDLVNDVILHQKIENKTGEWCKVQGDIIYIRCGSSVSLELESVQISSTLHKLGANIEDRLPLVCFWFNEETCENVLKEMGELETINVTKEIYTDITPKLLIENKSEFTNIFYRAKKIVNPHKIFFPFDIRQENCWWPVDQKIVARKLNFNFTEIIEKDLDYLWEYDTEEVLEEKEEEKQVIEEKIGQLTL